MADALTAPLVVAALVLGMAALAKLRSPGAAARAVGVGRPLVRAFAGLELALACWAAGSGGAAAGVVLALVYGGFAVLTVRLARAGSACGCFGAERTPASPIQSALSGSLGLACAAAGVADAHGAGWVVGLPAASSAVLVVGIAAGAYAVILAYSELPELWRSWSPA